ncbi:MAG: exo-alpha-sialidase, partial [Clostridia bacterium]|nr:exo-alpha-sialidase [Clostridia bacterium]
MFTIFDPNAVFPTPKQMLPIRGLIFHRVHTAEEDGYHFLLGAAIIRHKGTLYCSWGNSLVTENDDHTVLAQRRSLDDGRTWGPPEIIGGIDSGFGHSHGVYFEHGVLLYAFCPRARYDKIDAYPDLMTEAYRLQEDGTWQSLGIAVDSDFWPMCQPIVLGDGSLLMAGLKSATGEAAVALCSGRDVTQWEARVLRNPSDRYYWGETTVVPFPDRLTAIVRSGDDYAGALVSHSFDNGRSWSDLEESNLPIAQSKLYGGVLSTGEQYLVFNAPGDAHRDTLCIAVGNGCFERVYLIRHGYQTPPRYW